MDVQIECLCPPKADGEPRHPFDTVTLRETLDFRQATAVRNGISFAKLEDPDLGSADIMAILTEGYILNGVEAWTIQGLDDKGRPFAMPVTKPNIRELLLSDPLRAEDIGDAADELYGKAILLPLVKRALASSAPSPTVESTSPTRSGPRKSRTPSKPSSTTTIQTGGTATITSLPGGVSSSSPSSASAA